MEVEHERLRSPKIEVLGVYRLPISPKLIRTQAGHFSKEWVAANPEGAMRAAREELEETVLVELQTTPFDPWPPSGDLRVAFYMHLWDAERPLETSYGPVACPTPTAMPDRLWRLIPYRPVD